MQEVEWQFDAVDLRPVVRWLEARRPRAASPDRPGAPATRETAGRGAGAANGSGAGARRGSGVSGNGGRAGAARGSAAGGIGGGGAGAAPNAWVAETLPAQAPLVTFSPLEPRNLTDTYFDTPQWRFHQAGLVVRLRSSNGQHEATLKTTEAPVDGLRVRTELLTPLPAGDVQALMVADSRAADWVRSLAGKHPPLPLFTLATSRRPYAILLDGQPVGEVVLDETTVVQPPEADPIKLKRVEVEVLPTAIAQVRPFVDDLRAACRLGPAITSKFEAGLLTLGTVPVGLPEVGPVTLPAGPTMGELAYAVLRRAFLAFLTNEPGTRIGEDVEALHDMRVAARRMRAAMDLFAPALPVRARRLREELRWIASRLGQVRDLDTQLEWIAAWSRPATPDDQAALEQLTRALEKRRRRARRLMLQGLDTQRYARLISRLARTLRTGPPRRSPAARAPALAALPGLIEQRYASVTRAGENLHAGSPPEAFHRLRIRCKRLRYAVENARDLYGAPASNYVEVLVGLQDVLGLHQDALVAASRLQELLHAEARRLPPRAVFMMGRMSQRYDQQASKLRKQFHKTYLRVHGKSWSRLQRAMEAGQQTFTAVRWPPEPRQPSPSAGPPQEG